MMTLNRLFLIFLTMICFSLNTGWAVEKPTGFNLITILITNDTGETIPYFYSDSGNSNFQVAIDTAIPPGFSEYHFNVRNPRIFGYTNLIISTEYSSNKNMILLDVSINENAPGAIPSFSASCQASGKLHVDCGFTTGEFPMALMYVRITK